MRGHGVMQRRTTDGHESNNPGRCDKRRALLVSALPGGVFSLTEPRRELLDLSYITGAPLTRRVRGTSVAPCSCQKERGFDELLSRRRNVGGIGDFGVRLLALVPT
ncbi:unnamed protein product [Boreogadus saida]